MIFYYLTKVYVHTYVEYEQMSKVNCLPTLKGMSSHRLMIKLQNMFVPCRLSVVVIVSSMGSEDRRFESRQSLRTCVLRTLYIAMRSL
jgi:hypothetical protein